MPRKLFGPSKREIWRQLSQEVNGRFVEGGFFSQDKVEVRHGEWILTLDTYVVSTGKVTVIYTRMRAPYVNPGGFRFTIYRKGWATNIAKWLGMQDIEVGDSKFDEEFVIQGTQPAQVVALFSNSRLRESISGLRQVHLSVKDDEGYFGISFPEGVDELAYQVTGTIKDIDQLKRLFDVFAETLEHLCRMGLAYENDPGVQVK